MAYELEPIIPVVKRGRGRPKGARKFPTLREFIKEYLPYKLANNWHHELFYDILENKVIQGPDGKLTINKDPTFVNQNILALAPRFHSKSACFTINYPLYKIYQNPGIRIIIVSANEDIAVSFNRAIVSQLENNMKLIHKYGDLVPSNPKRWGEKAIIVKRKIPKGEDKDPTVAAIGVGGKLISRRADIIICDDIIDLETARTKSGRNKTKEWFENVLLPILEDDGQLIIAGTVWYKDDIYDYLWSESQFNIRLKLKALMYHEKYLRSGRITRYIPYRLTEFPLALKVQDIFDEKIIKKYDLYTKLKKGVLWPEKWDFEKLMRKKANMSSSAFMRQYLNEPSSEVESLFKEKILQRALERGNAKTMVKSWDNSVEDKYNYGHLIIGVGVDLAISKKKTSDNSAISVWGLNDKRDRIFLYGDYGKWSPDEIKQRVIEIYHEFKPVKIRVENISFQDIIRQELAEDIPVEGFHTSGAKKFSEDVGIAHVAMLAEQEKLIIPSAKGDKFTLERSKQLLTEMLTYSPDTHAGDFLMSTWFALDVLRDFDNKLRETRGFFPTTTVVEQARQVKAPNKVLLLNTNPRFFKFSYQSLVYIFREVRDGQDFIEDGEEFFIFVTREEKSIAYILQKETGEMVGKIEGDISPLMFCNLLERAGQYFNKAQIVIDRNGEGEAVFNEMQKRFYPNLICTRPGENGGLEVSDGFKISADTLPIAVDWFRVKVNNMETNIYDDSLLREMGEMMDVEGDKLILSFGTGQRFKTIAVATWLLDNYERTTKKLYNGGRKTKKKLNIPYLVFRK